MRALSALSNGRIAVSSHLRATVALTLLLICTAGCTSWRDYIHNGFKVGPNYCTPPAPVANGWIDDGNPNLSTQPPNVAAWWQVFHDPVLDALIGTAYRQNLTLRIACLRIVEARAQRAIAAGNLFPQSQQAFGDYTRTNLSKKRAGWHAGKSVLRRMDRRRGSGLGVGLLGTVSPGSGSGRCEHRGLGRQLR